VNVLQSSPAFARHSLTRQNGSHQIFIQSQVPDDRVEELVNPSPEARPEKVFQGTTPGTPIPAADLPGAGFQVPRDLIDLIGLVLVGAILAGQGIRFYPPACLPIPSIYLNNGLRSPCDTTMQVRLLDEPMIRQFPLCHRIHELHSEVTQELWDQLRHFEK
jgi:hypothetical protein